MDASIAALSVLLVVAVGGLVYALVLGSRWRALAAQHETALASGDENRQHLASELEHVRESERSLIEQLNSLGLKRSALEAEAKSSERLLDEQRRAFAEKEAMLKQHFAQRDEELGQRFTQLAAEYAKDNREAFLQLAQQQFKAQHHEGKVELEQRQQAVSNLMKPIAETLKHTEEKLGQFKNDWTQDRSTLQEQIRSLGSAGETLRMETSKLARALSRPEVRGRYGELQLRRVAELAGMVNYCDFSEQVSNQSEDGRHLRPDMVVRLPNQCMIAVDAKCNFQPYLDAENAETDAAREVCLERFASNVAAQVSSLGGKNYWAEFKGSPEIVVMFVPGDHFLDVALSRRSDLLEQAALKNVILASPSTLIGLLKAVHVGWRAHQIEAHGQELIAQGKLLLDRTRVALQHLAGVGGALQQASKKYNDFVSSYESRLEPVLRKFEDAELKQKDLPQLPRVDLALRTLALTEGSRPSVGSNDDDEPGTGQPSRLETAPRDEVS